MSMLSEQVKELRTIANNLSLEKSPTMLIVSKSLKESADTIETLSAKLSTANMGRSERHYDGCISRTELMQELSEIFQDDSTNDRFNYVLELADMYAEYECGKVSERYYGGGWIVLNDTNLPENEVLCCDEWGEMLLGYIHNAGEDCYDAENDNEYMNDCIAYMPLPKPYRRNKCNENVDLKERTEE